MPHLRLSPALGNAFAGNLCLECCQGHRQCTLCKKNWRFVLNILVFQLNDCQRSRLCHVSGNLVEVHGLRNVFAASLRRADCQGPLPCRLEQLVGFLTLHSASAMFSEDVDWKGLDFRVWRHLVGFATSFHTSTSVWKPHKESTASQFGTPNGVLHCSMSRQ